MCSQTSVVGTFPKLGLPELNFTKTIIVVKMYFRNHRSCYFPLTLLNCGERRMASIINNIYAAKNWEQGIFLVIFSASHPLLNPTPPAPSTVIFNEEHLRGVEPLLFPRRLLQSPCLLLIAAGILLHVSCCGEGDRGGCKF